MGNPPDDVGASTKGYTNSGDPRKVKEAVEWEWDEARIWG
jgi:hypothetical protein